MRSVPSAKPTPSTTEAIPTIVIVCVSASPQTTPSGRRRPPRAARRQQRGQHGQHARRDRRGGAGEHGEGEQDDHRLPQCSRIAAYGCMTARRADGLPTSLRAHEAALAEALKKQPTPQEPSSRRPPAPTILRSRRSPRSRRSRRSAKAKMRAAARSAAASAARSARRRASSPAAAQDRGPEGQGAPRRLGRCSPSSSSSCALQLRGGRDDEQLVRDALERFEQASARQGLPDAVRRAARLVLRPPDGEQRPAVRGRAANRPRGRPQPDARGPQRRGQRRPRGRPRARHRRRPGPARGVYTLVREDDSWRILPPRRQAAAP